MLNFLSDVLSSTPHQRGTRSLHRLTARRITDQARKLQHCKSYENVALVQVIAWQAQIFLCPCDCFAIGAGASSTATTYPGRLAVELAQRFPSQPIKILNHGVNGERAIDMLARFDKSVAAEHPDLVLWQIGTNAVLNGYELAPSTTLVRDGIRRMKTIGADVILIDPQFAPKVIAKPQIEDMVDLISTVAAQESVNLFHRFAFMRHWAKVDGMPFDAFVSPDGLHMNDWSYGCLAQALADAVAGAAMPNRLRAGTD